MSKCAESRKVSRGDHCGGKTLDDLLREFGVVLPHYSELAAQGFFSLNDIQRKYPKTNENALRRRLRALEAEGKVEKQIARFDRGRVYMYRFPEHHKTNKA